MRTEQQVLDSLDSLAAIKLGSDVYLVEGYVLDHEQQVLHLHDPSDGASYEYNLTDPGDMNELQRADFYELMPVGS